MRLVGGAADRRNPGGDRHLGDDQPGDGAGRDAGGGLPRRGAAAAARIAKAVFGLVGRVGMAGAGRQVRIIPRTGVDIVDDQADRRAGGPAFVGAGEDPDPVRLLPGRGSGRKAGAAAVEPGLDILFGEGEAGRAAVDDRADGGAVALTPGGEAEDPAEAVPAHGSPSAPKAGA